MIRRIREVLRLQAQRLATLINFPVFSGDASVQEVSGIELDSRLVGDDLHHAAAGWLINFCRIAPTCPRAAIEHPVVVVTVALLRSDRCHSSMRAPMAVGLRKSNGVPSTGANSPVGIEFASTGV